MLFEYFLILYLMQCYRKSATNSLCIAVFIGVFNFIRHNSFTIFCVRLYRHDFFKFLNWSILFTLIASFCDTTQLYPLVPSMFAVR